MKKMFLLLATTILSCLMAFANEVEVKVHVSTPGTLEDVIIDAGYRPMFVTKLIVSGTLNEDDVILIRETMESLIVLDAKEVVSGISFRNMSHLKNIILPDSWTIISSYGFTGCHALDTITIGCNVEMIDDHAFDIDFSDNSPITLSTIHWNARRCNDFSGISTPFYYNHYVSGFDIRRFVTKITFGDSVEYIPRYLCYGLENLTSIEFSGNVKEVGNMAFAKSGYSNIHISDVGAWCNINFYDYESRPNGNLYLNNKEIINLVIPTTVDSIKDYTFTGFSAITSVVIPNSVTFIGDYAFSKSSLATIEIPNGVTFIGSCVFSECQELMSVNIPNSVTSIGGSAFSYCSKLTTVVLSDYITEIPDRLFSGCSALKSFVISNAITTIGDEAFLDCSSLFNGKITFPSSVKHIGKESFKGCNLGSIECRSLVPPTATTLSSTIDLKTCKLIVPKVAYKDYLKHEYWGSFYDITTTDIDYKEIKLMVNNGIAGNVEGSGIYERGSETFIKAIPREGCSFVKWSDDNKEKKRKIVVTEDLELTAEFYMPPLISTIPERIENGYEGEIIIKYNPLAGDGGMKDANKCYAHTGLITENSTSIDDWKYATKTWRGGEDKYKMTKKDGIWELKIPNIYEYYGCPRSEEILKMAFVFNDGPDGEKEGKTEDKNDIFIDLNSDKDDFYELRASVVPLNAGRVVGTASYKAGVIATLTAMAYEGYRFKQWSDGNTDNPREIVVDKDIDLTAEFYMPPLISTIPERIEKGYEGEIIVIFNQTAGNQGMKDAFICYAHTGLVTPESNWKYGTAGWRDGDEKYRMTYNGCWELKIPNIYEFYGSPKSEEILKMVFVFNDGPNGEKEGKTAEGGDIFIELVEGTPVDNVTDEQQMVVVDDNRIYIVGYDDDYQVYNMSGQLVYSGNDSVVELSKGIYVIRMGEKSQKVVL